MEQKEDERKATSSDSEEPINLRLGDPFKGLEDSIVGTIFVNRDYRIKSIISSVTELVNLSSFDKDLDVNDCPAAPV